MEALDKALIGCIEIEYFSTKDITKKNFYEGLQQVFSFFDFLALMDFAFGICFLLK